MFEDKETCCFMQLVKRFIDDEMLYLLPVKEHQKTQPSKILLGYYDDEYVYIIPKVLITYSNLLLRQHYLKNFNMRKILQNLFALNLIKVHWVLTCEIRYRPEKRVGNTRKRYITFIRKEVKNKFKEDLIL